MDIAIVLLGAGACTVLSRRLHRTAAPTSNTQSAPTNQDGAATPIVSFHLLTVSAGLSIALFSISVLELIPTSLILWIKGNAILWVYHFVLWGMVINCFLVVPTACFLPVIQHARPPFCSNTDPDDKEHKKRSFRRLHWVHVWMYRPMVVVLGTLLQAMFCLVGPWLKSRTNHASSTLPLTVNATTTASTISNLGNSSSPSITANLTKTTWNSYYHLCMTTHFHPAIRKQTLVGALLASSCTYVALSRIRPWVIHTSDEVRMEESLFQVAISSLCAVGILLSACLNGFGSVSLPYTCLLGFVLHPVTDDSIRNAEKELEAVRSRLGSLVEQQPQRMLQRNATSEYAVSGDLRGMRRHVSTDAVFTTIDLDSSDDVVEQYPEYRRKAEVDFLLSLISDIVADIDEMKYVQTWSTKRGIARRVSGFVFSAILLYRLTTALWNVCFASVEGPSSFPLLAIVLAHTTSITSTDDKNEQQQGVADQQQQLAQVLSVFLTAVLCATQLRTFVTIASALQRRLWKYCCGCPPQQQQKTATATAGSVLMMWSHHAVGWLLCCYSLACVVLTKQMMGSEIDDTAEHLYLKFHIDRFTVDLTYGTSAILSASTLAIVLGILRANSQRYVDDVAAAAPRGMAEV